MKNLGKPSILVVEDDTAIQALLRAVLGSDYNLKIAGDGATALLAAAEIEPDLILLDVILPDMDGREICRRIKSNTRLAAVPVIFLTSLADPAHEVQGLEAGGIDYLAKPINPAILKVRVSNHLDLKRSRDALERMARLDGLTGLANRRTFDDMLAREWRRLARVSHPLSVIMMDVDHFKLYNDTYGHGGGDECLKQVAAAAAGALQRPADVVARYGGEEFVALLPDTTLDGALMVAEAIRTAVISLVIPHAGSKVASHVTLSLGAACTVPQQDGKPADLLEAADNELYAAKSGGRNQAKGRML
ncbi:MAG: diguanylate cyclase [Rhodospirillaceae bacterium]|nr:diguanylate cyclase [Rhodospirillaceae bacterium]